MTDADDIRAEALRLVNVAREAMGQEPLEEIPCGTPFHLEGCALNVALSAAQFGNEMVAFDTRDKALAVAVAWDTRTVMGTRLVELPPVLVMFAARFDAGQYPDLVEGEPA